MTAASLNQRLLNSQDTDLEGLITGWQADEVSITLPGMGRFTEAPSLGAKLRGAFGNVLLASASAAVLQRRPCDWPHTSTAEVFFGKRPKIRLGNHDSEIAKPFVFSCRSTRSGDLKITLRIFGEARARTAGAADALIAALRNQVDWQSLAQDTAASAPLNVEEVSVSVLSNATCCNRFPQSLDTEFIALRFTAPIDADRGNSQETPSLLLQRLLRRLALLAPWYGLSLARAFDELCALVDKVEFNQMEPASLEAASLGGHHRANRLTPPCRLKMTNVPPPLIAAMQLGVTTHIGRGASLGLGRYRLEWPHSLRKVYGATIRSFNTLEGARRPLPDPDQSVS